MIKKRSKNDQKTIKKRSKNGEAGEHSSKDTDYEKPSYFYLF